MLMTRLLLAVVIVLGAGLDAFADQSNAPTNNNVDVGRGKIVSGSLLVLAGVFVMPLTSLGDTRIGSRSTLGPGVGITLIGGGTGLVLWGMRDRYKASHPSIAVGTQGRAIFVRRSW
jgi:hypothetical protein